jgi:hypothetical protein
VPPGLTEFCASRGCSVATVPRELVAVYGGGWVRAWVQALQDSVLVRVLFSVVELPCAGMTRLFGTQAGPVVRLGAGQAVG